jgi:hypothetical protein
MANVIENYSKFEIHVVVRFLQAEGVSQSESLKNCMKPINERDQDD